VRHTRWPKTSLIGRAINYATFMLGCFWATLGIPRHTLVVVETDPPLLCILGAWLQWWKCCQLVVYLQDVHPEIGIALGKLRNGWLATMLQRWFHAIYRAADRVIVLSEDMQSLALGWGISKAKIALIPNWVDIDAVYPLKVDNRIRPSYSSGRDFVVMYSGNLGLCQQLDDILQAAELLQDERRIRFVFVGQGASRARLQTLANKRMQSNVGFFDYRPKSELKESLSAADLHLVPLDPRLTRYMMPSKLYGILASGTPLIAIAPSSHLARIVESERIGWVVSPGSPEALAQRIRECLDQQTELLEAGQRARHLAEKHYDRRVVTQQFRDFLKGLAQGKPQAAMPRPGEHSGQLLLSAQSEKCS
jgi:glycosyltransferase involved in cell wall biosynthesis